MFLFKIIFILNKARFCDAHLHKGSKRIQRANDPQFDLQQCRIFSADYSVLENCLYYYFKSFVYEKASVRLIKTDVVARYCSCLCPNYC